MGIPPWALSCIAALFSACCFAQSAAVGAGCTLTPIEEQLQIAELRTDELRADDAQYIENNYRKRLLRFVNSYYSNIAEDILRGQGEYLLSLHRLMGSTHDACTMTYKALLVKEVNSQDFGAALWLFRTEMTAVSTAAQTWAVPTCVDCNITERKQD